MSAEHSSQQIEKDKASHITGTARSQPCHGVQYLPHAQARGRSLDPALPDQTQASRAWGGRGSREKGVFWREDNTKAKTRQSQSNEGRGGACSCSG